jgi:TPR repeat protein
VACAGCLARHHRECWTESKRCASCGDRLHLLGGSARPRARFGLATPILIVSALWLIASAIFATRRQERIIEKLDTLASQPKTEAKPPIVRYPGESEAVRALHDKAEAGDMDAAVQLAVALQKGDGVEPSKDEGIRWCQRAADSGSVVAMRTLGSMFEKKIEQESGTQEMVDHEKAFFWYERAGKKGDIEALRAGKKLAYSWDADVHMKFVRLLAEAGDADAMLDVCNDLDRAKSSPEQRAELERWRERAVAALRASGKASDLRQLGFVFATGSRGMREDKAEALACYRKAAELGDKKAMVVLGEALIDGRSHVLSQFGPEELETPVDKAAGFRWLQKAAADGDLEGTRHLAAKLAETDDPASVREAVSLYRGAIVRGDADDDREALAKILKKHPDLRQAGDPSDE